MASKYGQPGRVKLALTTQTRLFIYPIAVQLLEVLVNVMQVKEIVKLASRKRQNLLFSATMTD